MYFSIVLVEFKNDIPNEEREIHVICMIVFQKLSGKRAKISKIER